MALLQARNLWGNLCMQNYWGNMELFWKNFEEIVEKKIIAEEPCINFGKFIKEIRYRYKEILKSFKDV